MIDDEFEPDGPLTPEQKAVVEKLSPENLAKIDEGLLSNCCDRWRKVAMVVGNRSTETANMIGITPAWLTLRGR